MLTNEQIEKLHKAIDLAEGPGKCNYVLGNKPQCVIGQLAHLEGVTVKQMAGWGKNTIEQLKDQRARSLDKLKRYPIHLLKRLQEAWDYDYKPQFDSRQKLHDSVDYYTSTGKAPPVFGAK